MMLLFFSYSQLPKRDDRSYLKLLISLLNGSFEKRTNCSKILLDYKTWIVKKSDIIFEDIIVNIIKAIGNQQYKSLEKLSHKVIIKKFEQEIDSDYVLERQKYVTKKGAQALGRNFSIIKNCRNLCLDIKASEGLQNISALREIVKYAFRISYNFEDISKFLSQYLNSKPEFSVENSNKWICFIWIHNSDSLLIDWLKNDTYIVKFIDKPKSTANKSTLIIFRERQSFTNSFRPFSFKTFEDTVSEEIRKVVIDLIDEKSNDTKNVEMKRILKQKLEEKYLNENFDCYLSRYEYYLLLNKHESKNKILGFTHKQFSVLISQQLYSSIRDWPEIIGLRENLQFEEREVIEKGLLSQQLLISDATSVKIVSFMETGRKCIIFYNSKIDDKFPKGIFDKCFYLKTINCKSDSLSVENNSPNNANLQNSTVMENNCITGIIEENENFSQNNVETQSTGICNTEVDKSQIVSKAMKSNSKTENIESTEPLHNRICENPISPIPSISNSEVNTAEYLRQNNESMTTAITKKNKNYVIKYSISEVSKITACSDAIILNLSGLERRILLPTLPEKEILAKSRIILQRSQLRIISDRLLIRKENLILNKI